MNTQNTQIDSANVKGEPGTGFEQRSDKGPFECGNCEYFDGSSCGQQDMMARSQQPKAQGGRIQVGAQDCCEYIERKGGDNDSDDQTSGKPEGMGGMMLRAAKEKRAGGAPGGAPPSGATGGY